jgi:hypothetical protein
LGQLPQGRGAGLNNLGGSLGGAVHHLLLHLGGPQPCAGGHIQGGYFPCPLYRSGRSPDWLKFKNPAAVKREAEEDCGR